MENESGVFALVPVSADGGRAEHGRFFIAMWYPHTTGELFVYEGVLDSTEDVGSALHALSRDLDVDPLPFAAADASLHRAFVAAEVAKGDAAWRRMTRLDHTPDVTYRRAWTMAEHAGRVFTSTLPSGRVYSFAAGVTVGNDRVFPSGWHHVAAVKQGDRLRILRVNGLTLEVSPKE